MSWCPRVVSSYHPTSNRNDDVSSLPAGTLYLLIILHQTATMRCASRWTGALYLLIILHQTATNQSLVFDFIGCIFLSSYIKPQPHDPYRAYAVSCIFLSSYIKPQLFGPFRSPSSRCIFLSSYIKPQPVAPLAASERVVSSYHPTSNRNSLPLLANQAELYLLIILHQTATCPAFFCCWSRLYLLIILHQTATPLVVWLYIMCCIFLSSYIKPQLR